MSGLSGPDFYDDDVVFANYWATRDRPDNPNDVLEKPILSELVGNLAGLRILDLGCGAATFGRRALAHRCLTYVGIDASQNMIAAANETLAGMAGRVELADVATWDYPELAFDLVVASLALHFVADLEAVFAGVHRSLVDGGRFVFSVEHPIITSCSRGWQTLQRQDWIVDDYFVVGPRETTWLGGEVIRQHRTIEDYVLVLQHAGFVLDRLRESRPQRERFSDEGEYERRLRVPLFLFLAGHKPGPHRSGQSGP